MGMNEKPSRSAWNPEFIRLSEKIESSCPSIRNQRVEPFQGCVHLLSISQGVAPRMFGERSHAPRRGTERGASLWTARARPRFGFAQDRGCERHCARNAGLRTSARGGRRRSSGLARKGKAGSSPRSPKPRGTLAPACDGTPAIIPSLTPNRVQSPVHAPFAELSTRGGAHLDGRCLV